MQYPRDFSGAILSLFHLPLSKKDIQIEVMKVSMLTTFKRHLPVYFVIYTGLYCSHNLFKHFLCAICKF